jgi:hypothetical protein
MRPQLPEKVKREIIRLWMLGHPRDDIARDTNTSSGSVSNVIENWKNDLDRGEADALRELGKAIRASGLSPSECAAGARTTNLLTKNGVNIDKAEQFLSTTYKKCENLDLTPDKIVSHIEDLTKLSDEISLPEIERVIKQKTSEKEGLDKQIYENKEKVSNVKRQAKEIEKRRDCAFEMQRKAGEDILLFNEVKQELEKHNVPISDISKFARAVKVLAENGYRPDWMIAKIEEMFHFNLGKERLKAAVSEMEKKYQRLNEQNIALEQQMNSYSEILPIYRALEHHGVGHRELLMILEAVVNISVSNGIPYGLAIEKFINDVRTQYESKLGFESKIEDLKCLPSAFQTVSQLYKLGLKNVDILQLGKVYLTLSKKTYSIEDMATGLAKIVDLISSMTKSGVIKGDSAAKILSDVRERLSHIHFTT